MALKDYPDWVLKHKGNGREIRCIRGRYYLYQVHSERMNGKVKKFTDKYLGRITEEGLIPPRPKKVEYHAKRFGLTAFIFSSCRRIIKGLIKRYPSKHKKLLSLAILKYFFDNDLREYDKHYISVLFPEVKIKEEKMSVQDEIDRIVGMMDHAARKELKCISWEEFKKLISPLYIVGVKGAWTVAQYNKEIEELIKKHNIEMEIDYGENQ